MNCNEILIIEDDDDIREILKTTLELEGYNVSTANNGKEGLEKLPFLKAPCLIILDLMMPVMDGWTFAEIVGKESNFSKIPIVVITAFSKENTKTLKKVKTIIKKPIDLDLLLPQVSTYCTHTSQPEIAHQ